MTNSEIKKRITQYIDNGAWQRHCQRSTLKYFWERFPESVIFGGMIRDFALDLAREFKSDIDIVTTADTKNIERALKPFSPERNKFGGFRFHHKGFVYDAWSLQETWAVKNKIIQATNFQELCDTTFFNLDAVAMNHIEGDIYTAPCFKEGLKEKVLNINLASHPSPSKISKRAISLATNKKLSLAPPLFEYILDNIEINKNDSFYLDVMKKIEAHALKNPHDNFLAFEQLSLDLKLKKHASRSRSTF